MSYFRNPILSLNPRLFLLNPPLFRPTPTLPLPPLTNSVRLSSFSTTAMATSNPNPKSKSKSTSSSSSRLKLVLGPRLSDAYKVFTAAEVSNSSLVVTTVDAARKGKWEVVQVPCLLIETEGSTSTVFGANAICWHLLRPILGGWESSDSATLDLLTWEERELEPMLGLNKTRRSNGNTTCLGRVLEKFKEPPKFSLISEIIVASTLAAMKTAAESAGASFHVDSFNNVNAFLQRVAKSGHGKSFEVGQKTAEDALSKTPWMGPSGRPTSAPIVPGDAMQQAISAICKEAVFEAFPVVGEGFEVHVEPGKALKKNQRPPELQLAVSMRVFSVLKDVKKSGAPKNPRQVADMLVSHLEKQRFLMLAVVDRLEVAGAGFVNIYLKREFIQQFVRDIVDTGKPRQPSIRTKRTVGVDFSSPNICKEMHVGHLRSTIIGDTICKLLEYRGHNVHRINHIGDWGTSFGMILRYIFDEKLDITETTTLSDLNAIYKSAKQRFGDDEEFKTRSREQVVKLQSYEEPSYSMWKKLVELSMKGYDEVYSRLQVSFPHAHCGESFYQSRIPKVVKELEDLGMVVVEGGAKLIKTSVCEVPLFLQKSDGGFGYDSTDMTALKYRSQELGLDWIVYVTDSGQHNHFMSCFEATRKAKWFGGKGQKKIDLEHIGFGLVLGADGKRFRSRAGDTIPLQSLLDEAKDRIHKELEDRLAKGETPLKKEEIEPAAAAIGFAAIKYADLKTSKERDYTFDYDLMLQPNGNTGVYILYTYARLSSIESTIKESLGISVEDIIKERLSLLNIDPARPAEWELAFALLRFSDVIEEVTSSLSPHVLCAYVYDICSAAAKFYTHHRLLVKKAEGEGKELDPEHGKDWVCLLYATRLVLKESVPLLGITLIDRV